MGKNQMSKGGAGGGPGSKSLAKVNTYFTDHQSARGVNPGHVAQFGEAQGNRAMDKQTNYRGDPKGTAAPAGGAAPLGNAVATNVGGGGPGTGRVLYGQCGTQQQYGKPEGTVRPPGRSFDDRGPKR